MGKWYAKGFLFALFTYFYTQYYLQVHENNTLTKCMLFLNKRLYHFMAALPFSLVFKNANRIGDWVRSTHLGEANTGQGECVDLRTKLRVLIQ